MFLSMVSNGWLIIDKLVEIVLDQICFLGGSEQLDDPCWLKLWVSIVAHLYLMIHDGLNKYSESW